MITIKTILVPIDFSDNAEHVMEYALSVAQQFKASILLCFVAQLYNDYSDFFIPQMPVVAIEEEIDKAAKERMHSFTETFSNETKIEECVLIGNVAHEILHLAEKREVDLIVMGTHGYQGIEKILFGSVAEKVVKMAPCAVLTVKPKKA
ncbi:MAG: universal stress protein [Thermodesulfobacteriota bacterium]